MTLGAGLAVLTLAPSATPANASERKGTSEKVKISVTVHKGGFATVNSYILSNGRSLTVIDVQRTKAEAQKLADQVRRLGLPLRQVLITHGHTDHFAGMPLFRDQFPQARILAANKNIRRDIKDYAVYMDGLGALDESLRPKSRSFPQGFDYEHDIKLLGGKKLHLQGGGSCEVETDYPATEAHYMTTVYCPSNNALFLSDLAYNKVHPWMGDDITLDRVAVWREELGNLRDRYRSLNPVVYPGHGDPGDLSMLNEQIGYFDNYLRIVRSAKNIDDATARITALYPDYKEADFFLHWSLINHMS
ncbi:MBL fold metallo-hydrolase [Nonomuraea angiospora]|uniref:Glyoxylase-like metal-dependent hydrolase (Beta-lactamase superfamily II) n=1 Tax=Nonomuraea angiospora TaxID=46172 RepID=A0ABR9LR26_9ACTN|nr:MBL fold metallo-hydrolase [Nonomuraea angiospora]MBE1582733.1 glyoxylase-like metal-dependent hydrolase (beta-lactamase superfamily II) [Nonomuraea angiospora]